LRASTLKTISKETEAETKEMKRSKIIDAFNRAVSRNKLLGRYEKKISVQDNMIMTLKSNEEKQNQQEKLAQQELSDKKKWLQQEI
jgi:hypothetical protein